MKNHSLSLGFAIFSVSAERHPFSFAPEIAHGRIVSWQSDREPIPPLRPALEVSFTYVCHGPVEINAALDFFAADGTFVEHKFMRPSLKIPAKSEWGKPSFHAFTLQSTAYPAKAESVRLSLSGTARPAAAPEPPRLDLNAVDFKWAFTPRGVRTANWFTLGEDVVFCGGLPPGKTGLRTLVRDSSGQIVHRSDATSAEWRWRPSRPGFYTAAFAWLDASGNATPAVESLYCCDHLSTTNAIFRNRFATFARGEQAFVICATPERDVAVAKAGYRFDRIIMNTFGTPTWNSTAPESLRKTP